MAKAPNNLKVLRKLSQELTETEEELSTFFHICPDLLCITDGEGNFKKLNPSWTAVLGWSVEELRSRPWIELVHPQDRAKTARAFETMKSGKSVLDFINRYRHRDGGYRTLSWRASPVVNSKSAYAIARVVKKPQKRKIGGKNG